jgi:hypothetical protein
VLKAPVATVKSTESVATKLADVIAFVKFKVSIIHIRLFRASRHAAGVSAEIALPHP